MEPKNIVKQVFDFQKSAFTNTYNTMALIQDQSEKVGSALMEQNPMVPQQFKSAANDWIGLQKKFRDDCKKAVDESLKNFENFFSETVKSK